MSESLVPNPIEISANGDIIVPGILLPEAPNDTLGQTNAVAWEDANGVIRSYIQGVASNTGTHDLIFVSESDGPDSVSLFATTTPAGGAGTASLDVTASDSAGNAAFAKILDSLQRSTFLQQVNAAKTVLVEAIPAGLTWPGATNIVTYNYAHGRPAPAGAIYLATFIDFSNSTAAFAFVRNPTVNGCQVLSYNPVGAPPVGTSYGLYILAILQY